MDVIEWIRAIVDAGYGWELAIDSFIVVGALFAYFFDLSDPEPGPYSGGDFGDWGGGDGGGD